MSTREAEQRAFIRAWGAWRKTPLPVEHFRQGRSREPAYATECALDHLRSHVYSIGSAFIEDRPWDYPTLAADQLERLHAAESELEEGEIPEDERAPYREYVAATRLLLHRLLACAAASPD